MKAQRESKWLDKSEIERVHPKFHTLVQEAFAIGEKVPRGVLALSWLPANQSDIEWALREIVERKKGRPRKEK